LWLFKPDCGNDDMVMRLLLVDASSMLPIVQIVGTKWRMFSLGPTIQMLSLNRPERWSAMITETVGRHYKVFRPFWQILLKYTFRKR
jgi:hypothetical protein